MNSLEGRSVMHKLLARLGLRSRKVDAPAPTDSSTSLYNRTGLLAEGELLLAQCRAQGRELTMAVFDCSDLLEARQVYGTRTARKLIDSIIGNMAELAGDRGLTGRTGSTQFTVLMPMTRDKAVAVIEDVLGNPSRFEFEDGSIEIVLVPNLMVEAVPKSETLERMFAALSRGLVRVRDEEILRNRYLKRERERHSRPMPVQAEMGRPLAPRPSRPPVLGPDPVLSQQIPTTIPMPLPTR